VLGMRKQSQAFANSTLFDITAQSIFADREHFLDLFECTEINPFDQLCKHFISLHGSIILIFFFYFSQKYASEVN
jgi:hypothetical protein